MTNLPTAPHCPVNDCPGEFIKKQAWNGSYYDHCDTCGTHTSPMAGSAAEWVHIKLDRARKRAKKKAPTKAQVKEAKRVAARQMVLEVVQLPVRGWSANEWFPGCVAPEGQMGMGL